MYRSIAASTLALTLLAAPAVAQPSPESPIAQHVPVGQGIDGGERPEAAPELSVGLFQDVLERGESAQNSKDGTVTYYRLPRPAAGERLSISAQLIVDPMREPSSNRSIGLSAEIVGDTGNRCSGSETARTSRNDIDRLALVTLITERLEPERDWPRSGCLADPQGQPWLRIERTGEWQDDQPVPVELRLLREPAIDPTILGEAVTEDMTPHAVQLTGEATDVSGGTGFSTATALADGSIFADSILPFETKYYKVHVAAGQRLNYRVVMGDSREASARGVTVSTYNPLLEDDLTLYAERSLRREDVSSFVTQNLATAVSPDLVESHGRYRSLSVPGDYYLMISGDARDPRGLNPLKYEIAVELTGQALNATEWASQVQASADSEAGIGAQNASADTWVPDAGQLGALLGGVAVALGGYALWWLLRRRRHG
ncbi:hypothetical protein [Glutamicibacter sp. PS]|uniref:hypothetical protein n=1 Tax=Glutamicibacter sp. PS TaxID=3075634 RepID=UPI00283D0877|nr:hypothetical protein [Glutamicibacter sp. PS]MDR4534840.1 hypothetical protein [Glutamicibacter sp. PS]